MSKQWLLQTILDGREPEINRPVSTVTIVEAGPFDDLLVFDHAEPLGISPGFSETGQLIALAVADSKECRIIEFKVERPKRRQQKQQPSQDSQHVLDWRRKLQDKVLCRPIGDLFAFDMGPLAMSLHSDLGIRVTNAIDIQSSFSAVDRRPISVIEEALGEFVKIKQENVKNLFIHPVYQDRNSKSDLFMRAWVSQFIATFKDAPMRFAKAKKIDTKNFDDHYLSMVAKIATDATRLDHLKPRQIVHQVTQAVGGMGEGGMEMRSTDFKSRMRRPGGNLQLTMDTPTGTITTNGVVGAVSGRKSTINSTHNVQLGNKEVLTVVSIGRDDPTTAEAKRAAIVLRILQGENDLLGDSPWIQNIWFNTDPDVALVWPEAWSRPSLTPPLSCTLQSFIPPRVLNPSQQTAVNMMCSEQDEHRITIIQGPPGTGKTSVISFFVQLSVQHFNRRGIWLVAQSNVAVKNIAEKLIKDGFLDWKLLVSKDFHYDWHEHLYGEEIQPRIIQSTEFPKFKVSKLKGIHVMLCTLSMLSNNHIKKFTRCVPVHTLVVDEASQIEIGGYISVFSSFKDTLHKVCFIGDDKQLPPFGQEDIQDLQSIFEITHLRKLVLFLDTQYRMPPQIGEVISEAVYDGKLKSNPQHPITSEIVACHFINISDGREKQHENSFMNEQECQAILKLARKLQANGKSYRIITPYEAQRSHIETSMKKAELEWADTCFNVDSFQGNEDDHIIISVVRNREMGFLNNLRRTNVMLSRCKKGMFIFSSQQFLAGPGAETLVGTFLTKMGNIWLSAADFEEKIF